MATIQDFAFIGVKNLLVKDKKTKEVVAELPYLVGFNLSDNQPIEYLRGGFERLKLLPFKGDRETSVTDTTATSCPDLLKLQLNTEFEDAEQIFDQIVNLEVVGGVAHIPADAPVAEGTVMTVNVVDNMGKKSKLVAGESVSAGVYVYDNGTITVSEDVASVRVMYQTKKSAQVLKAKDVDTKTEVERILGRNYTDVSNADAGTVNRTYTYSINDVRYNITITYNADNQVIQVGQQSSAQ